MTASAFDLLRSSQRRTRQVPISHAPLLDGTGSVGAHPAAAATPAALARPRAPLPLGAVGVDERHGLWWAVQGSELLYFPLRGPQWPPSAVQALPEDAVLSARCVALLDGLSSGGQSGGSRGAGPCAVAVLPDLRVVVFHNGERLDVPRPEGAPLAQVPAFVAAAGPHPAHGGLGVALVVGTRAGGLFTLLVRQRGERFEAEASPLWSMDSPEGGLRGWLKRVRRSLSGEPEHSPLASAAAAGEDAFSCSVRSVEVVAPPAGSDALFAVLAVGEEVLSCFLQPRKCGAAAELAWIVPASQLVGGHEPRLLQVRCNGEDPQAMLLLFSGRATAPEESAGNGAAQDTVLARLPWPARGVPPQAPAGAGVLAVGPAPQGSAQGGQVAFLAASPQLTAIALRAQERRWVLLSVLPAAGDGMRMAEACPIEADVLGVALLAQSTACPGVVVLTPHGPLESAAVEAAPEPAAALPPAAAADASEALRLAHTLYAHGQEAKAASTVSQAFAVHGAAALLPALERCAQALLDTSDVSGARWQGVAEDVVTRHLLFDKARDLEQWASFLTESGLWARLAALPGALAARQALAEACERVAAASRLRELHDREPEIIAGAIHRALQEADWPEEATGSSEAHIFYARASCCERLLSFLAEYPRSLPLGSAGATEAVVFANGVAVAFLEAAMDRRGQLIASHPLLLPPPDEEQARRHLEGSVRPPRGVGSCWLLSPRIRQALEDLRLVSLEVMPQEMSCRLPLLQAQALQVLESLRGLCRASLRAASASYCDLHGGPMVQLRATVLEQLAEAEVRFAPPGSIGAGPQGVLVLAEEFEDFEAMVNFLAAWDSDRLEEQLARSRGFRAHALRQFLRTQALQPWFFRTARRFQLPAVEIEELLAPYPELRWTLEVEGLDEASAEEPWRAALEEVERRAAGTLQRERHSAAKRDAFAALAALARAAAGAGGAVDEPAVAEAACLGRLQQACHRFSKEATSPASVGSKRPSPSGPPASAEDCLDRLCKCFGAASSGLRVEGCERQFFADAAHLVRLLERALRERGVDLVPLLLHDPSEDPLAASKDKLLAQSLQSLWAEAVLADEGKWQQVLVSPEGEERRELIEQTGLYCMLAWRGPPGPTPWTVPRSADLAPLCGAFERLRPLAPALRLALAAAAKAAAAPATNGVVGASAAMGNAR